MYHKIIQKIKTIRWALVIGAGFLEKINILQWVLLPGLSEDIKIRFQSYQEIIELTLPNNRDQIMTLKGVFLNGDWMVPLTIHPKIIFDLGSYTGISVAFFLAKYPEATIYAFEPNPQSLGYLIKNFSQNPRVKIFNCAISREDGSAKLHTPNQRALSSSLVPRNHLDDVITVTSCTFNTISKDLDTIDLIKFNIEGGEENLFTSDAFYQKVRAFIGEVHGDLLQPPYSLDQLRSNANKHFTVTEKTMSKDGRGIWLGFSKDTYESR
jgi:FkbM family methyltransferase